MTMYHQPASLDEALTLYSHDPSLMVLAGATDVYPAKATRAGWGSMQHPDVLDLSRMPGLRGVEDRGDHWRIGALTTWSDIVAAALPPLFDGLKAAAREIGGIQIQNRGTVGGNLCTASPAGDSIPCLLTLDADVVLVSVNGRRTLPLSSFLVGYRKTALQSGEIVEAVCVPNGNGHGHFSKLGARRYLVISIAMVAAVFEWQESHLADGKRGMSSLARPDQSSHPGPVVERARIAVGACSAVAGRLHELEQALVGRALDPALVRAEHLAHLTPIDDVRASGAYRRAAALQLVRDVVDEAIADFARRA